ncbi:MAG: hypothetical protein PF450_13395 [Bacteroidales bacterium]|jgi:HEAT repeat protein|nr:hypothetical protein [Bacteroidales bacterium]
MEENKEEQKIKAQEVQKNQISILRSGNSKAILSTLEEIRNEGPISVLPEIFELMLITEDKELISACLALLSDLKSSDAVPVLITALQDKNYIPIRHLITSACWQNGLDYHENIHVFSKIIQEDDFLTAIEAFTVVENSIGDLDDPSIVKLTDSLQCALEAADEQKNALITELLSAIKNF